MHFFSSSNKKLLEALSRGVMASDLHSGCVMGKNFREEASVEAGRPGSYCVVQVPDVGILG